MQIIPQPRVRLANRQELGALQTIVADAFAAFRRHLPAHIFQPSLEEACDFAGRWADTSVAVIERDGRLVGTVTYYPDAARQRLGWPSGLAGLRALAVAPWAQGHGHGRAL